MQFLSLIPLRCLNLLLPTVCGGCGAPSDAPTVCRACMRRFQRVVSREISLNSSRTLVVHAVGAYDGPLMRLVLGKARGDRIAARELGMLMASMIGDRLHEFDCIVPVPLHWTRTLWRGYDQVYEIGGALSRATGIPLLSAVRKIRRTPFQSTVSASVRADNCRNAFVLTRLAKNLADKRVLIIDDVMTTGATLSEVARVIAQAHPASITALVGARAV